jgi:opacity protein-like surface antigen
MHSHHFAIPSALALLGALCVSAPPLHAQQMTNLRDYTIGVGGAAGLLIPSGSIGDGASTGWNLQGFADWTSRTRPFGVRGDISYGSLSGKDFTAGSQTIAFDDLHLFSITGDAMWLIRPAQGSTSRTTPYVLAGIGLYHSSQTGNVAGEEIDNGSTNFGFNFGGGFQYQLAGFSTFGEIRYHNVFSGAEDGSAHYIPIVVGLRFGTGR